MKFNLKEMAQIAVVILLISVLAVNTATASTLTVSPDGSANFTTIQQAVGNAKNGDTIRVYPGTYNENVNLLKINDGRVYDLTLEGISFPTITGNFTLDASYSYYKSPLNININGFNFTRIFYINHNTASGAQIIVENNKFTHSDLNIWQRSYVSPTIRNNTFLNARIFVSDEANASIIHNTFTSCSQGINTMYPGVVTIIDNTFSENVYGIYEYPRSPNDGGQCIIKKNKFSNNDVGILCYGQKNTIEDNSFNNNGKAINLKEGVSNITANKFELNDIGINLDKPDSRLSGQIYNNYFYNNVNVAGDFNNNTCNWSISKTNGVNIAGGPYLGGNFWGKPDLSGFSQITPDINNDGFCDSEYPFGGKKVDHLPLAETPDQQIQHMINLIQGFYSSGKLDREKSTILLAELNLIKKSIKTGKNKAAIVELNLFKINVKTYIKKGILTSTDGKTLINGANNIINDIK